MHPKAVIEAEKVGELANETLSIVELLLGHDRYWILGRMLRLPFGCQPCLRKAVDLSRQGDARLR